MVQAQFEQDAGGDFGEGRAPTAGFGLARGGFDLWRVGQTELRAIQRDQPPAAPEGVGLGHRLGPRAQAQAQPLGEDLPRQAGAALAARTVGDGRVEELGEMFGEGAGGVHKMKDQGREELRERDAGLASAPPGQDGHDGAKTLAESRRKTSRSR